MRALVVIIALFLFGCDRAIPHLDPEIHEYDTAAETWLRAQVYLMNNPGDLFIVANTGSMEPLLTENDLLIVVREGYADLKLGKVVTYRASWRNDDPVTHRLVRQSGDEWVVAGDANGYSDPVWMSEEEYIGTVIKVYRAR